MEQGSFLVGLFPPVCQFTKQEFLKTRPGQHLPRRGGNIMVIVIIIIVVAKCVLLHEMKRYDKYQPHDVTEEQ
jgi:hypothetical protein